MKIIEPPAPLEYTEVTEPVAQALRFEVTVFLRVLHALQGAARVVKFIFSRESSCLLRDTRNHENRSLTEITEHTEEFNRLVIIHREHRVLCERPF